MRKKASTTPIHSWLVLLDPLWGMGVQRNYKELGHLPKPIPKVLEEEPNWYAKEAQTKGTQERWEKDAVGGRKQARPLLPRPIPYM